MENHQHNANSKIFSANLGFIALCFLIALAGLGYILATLPGIAECPTDPPRTCITGGWKFALIITHILPFALIPLAMRIFYQSLNNLGCRLNIFASQLDLSFCYGGDRLGNWLACYAILVLSK